MRAFVRGTVSSSGGGWEHIVVDSDTNSYIDGRVVIVHEPTFDRMAQAEQASFEALEADTFAHDYRTDQGSFSMRFDDPPAPGDWNTMPDTDRQISADEHRNMLQTAIDEMQNHSMFNGDAIVAVLGHIRATLPERYNTEPPLTPEAQAVLNAAGAWAKTIVGSPEILNPKLRELLYAFDAYYATQRPPDPIVRSVAMLESAPIVTVNYFDGTTVRIDVSDPSHPTIKEQ